MAGAKTISYAENVVALAHAHERGADEAILANTVGALCEGTGTNVFVVQGGRVRTPSLSTGCLAGITRELVLELIDVEETDALTSADLRGADEAFLTSSTRDVHPIASVDGAALPARGRARSPPPSPMPSGRSRRRPRPLSRVRARRPPARRTCRRAAMAT